MARESPRILIVDDEADITSVLKLGLESHGFRIDAYNDPADAVGDFKPGVYDLAILDINMPQMNGFQVYRALKKADEDIQISFLTAFEMYENEFKKLFPDVQVYTFLKKPISIGHLISEVNKLVADGDGHGTRVTGNAIAAVGESSTGSDQ